MKIIYATGNKEKVKQVENYLKAIGLSNIQMSSLKDIGFNEDIVEDGETFEENSRKKLKL